MARGGLVMVVREECPKSTEELAEVVRREQTVICGASGPFSMPTPYLEAIRSKSTERLNRGLPDDLKLDSSEIDTSQLPAPESYVHIKMSELSSITKLSKEDLVVSVQAGMSLGRLQDELAEHDLCLPVSLQSGYPGQEDSDEFDAGTWLMDINPLEWYVNFDLPHGNESLHGSWRDWILGMTVVLADGTIAKAGSSVVKNVAGYDLHRFLIGARGTLGIVTELTLKVLPRKTLLPCPVQFSPKVRAGNGPALIDAKIGIHRVPRSEFQQAMEFYGGRALAWDSETGTIWADLNHDESSPGISGGWVVRRFCGPRNLEVADPAMVKLMRRAKEVFDPGHKLNPGAMGIF